MSWQSKVLGLCKKYGSSAKFAATTILGAVVPGSPAVISLVEQAFDAAQKSGQDDWEISVTKQLQTTADNQARLEQMLDVLGSDLQHVFAQMASLQQMPELARQMLEVARANDARCQEAAQKLDGIAHRFDRLEQQNSQILAGQMLATGILEELLPTVRKLASAPMPTVTSPTPSAAEVRDRDQLEGLKARCERARPGELPSLIAQAEDLLIHVIGQSRYDALVLHASELDSMIREFSEKRKRGEIGTGLWSGRKSQESREIDEAGAKLKRRVAGIEIRK